MITFKSMTIKNFLSVGNVSQAVNLDDNDLILVLGENLDQGGNDSKNGVGKTAIANALSYALFGDAIVKIKKDNLVNKINSKGMLVTLDFVTNGTNYRIERGRRPNVFKLLINGKNFDDTEDESQGENRHTQAEVERIIGLSHDMFKQIIALNTYNQPFLAMRAHEQRSIIEQLLGITKLSEKAEILKEKIKLVKDQIKEEEFKIKAAKESNKRIEDNIRSIRLKEKSWNKSQKIEIESLSEKIVEMESLNIEEEISHHTANKKIEDDINSLRTLERDLLNILKQKKSLEKSLEKIKSSIDTISNNECPTCGSDLDSHKHEEISSGFKEELKTIEASINELSDKARVLEEEILEIGTPVKKKTFYDRTEDAYSHRTTIEHLTEKLSEKISSENPYTGQISDLESNSLVEVDFTTINDLTDLKDHQEFLLKLLTNKDSFIRKKIIDQNLAYLNNRLSHYLEKVGLPHEVKFMSDLEVEITQYGREFDFDNLSRGERTRVILSLSWAFRDVYESLNSPVNLLFIDELIDNGLDTSGVESSLAVLKQMTRDSKRNIFLISHREELVGRVSSVLKVIKEGGFTSFDTTDTNLI